MESHLYLAHHGIKGMKWGVRRFQNKDGSLTSAGKTRYGVADEGFARGIRTRQVQRVGRQQDKINASVNAGTTRKVAKAQAKVAKAQAKVAKAQAKVNQAKLRAEYVKDRNERLKQTNIAYAKKTFKERLKDPDTWFDRSFYRATMETSEKMKEKYGDKRVNELENHDNMVVLGTAFAAYAVALAGSYAYYRLEG